MIINAIVIKFGLRRFLDLAGW